MSDNSSGHLASLISRWEGFQREIQDNRNFQKEVMAEAKSAGYDCKVIRRLLRERRVDPEDLREEQTLLDQYKRALGEFVTTPLGEAALSRIEPPRWES